MDVVTVESVAAMERAVSAGHYAITGNPGVHHPCGQHRCQIEATGHVEYGTRICHDALKNGKHAVLIGAEVDASVGPILRTIADTTAPSSRTPMATNRVAMNLLRFVDSMGYKPVLVGQMKGFLDRYRNPATQTELANKLGQNPAVLACFADGSKLALEAAIMGNATGFVPQVRGMKGYPCAHVNDMLKSFSAGDFATEGFVEYSLGAAPILAHL